MREWSLNATLLERREVTADLAILRVQPEGGRVLGKFVPGQYVSVGVASGEERERLFRRVFSITSAPTDPHLEFFVVRVPEGRFTTMLWELGAGDRLWLDDRPRGDFTLERVEEQNRDLLMVASGTGIGPYISMLRSHATKGLWRRFVLLHGVRRSADLAYRDELEAICRDDPTVRYLPILSREPSGSNWEGLRGRVQDVLEPREFERLIGVPLSAEDFHVYACGNPQMILSLRDLLEGRGFRHDKPKEPGNFHTERYW